MVTKEIHDSRIKFKKGNLYLYKPKNYLYKHFFDTPVLTLCNNNNYPTWLCLFPDGTTEGVYPYDLADIPVKRNV